MHVASAVPAASMPPAPVPATTTMPPTTATAMATSVAAARVCNVRTGGPHADSRCGANEHSIGPGDHDRLLRDVEKGI